MKILFDENLSPALVQRLSDVFPGANHVRELGLSRADDSQIWSYAKGADLAIVSKDSDFRQRAFLFGPPPKVISVCLGNCTTTQVEALLRDRALDIERFLADAEAAVLVLP